MPRWLIVLVLAILLPCYAFAAVGQSMAASMASAAEEDGHAAAHLAGEAHHHHDDGSFHADDSDESVQHLHSTDFTTGAALIVGDVTLPVLPTCSPAPPSWAEAPPPVPFLEGLRRPPRSSPT
jgi:hypothetical protein